MVMAGSGWREKGPRASSCYDPAGLPGTWSQRWSDLRRDRGSAQSGPQGLRCARGHGSCLTVDWAGRWGSEGDGAGEVAGSSEQNLRGKSRTGHALRTVRGG